jgi:hypothetical protein
MRRNYGGNRGVVAPTGSHQDWDFFIPEGLLKIARCFSIGGSHNAPTSPEGTAETSGTVRPSLRDLSPYGAWTQR